MKPRILIFSLCLALAACANPDKDWQLASRDDSRNAYLEFLAKHPDSDFADQARLRLNELKVINAWERAEFKNTLAGYDMFLDKHSDSEFADTARQRAREIQREAFWESVTGTEDKVALEAFIAEYPGAPQIEDARTQLALILAAEETARPKERPGNFRVQLAAFKTAASAELELRRLVELAPELLLGPVIIESPEPGSRGMFILKSVPMTGSEARSACAGLKARGQDCLMINR